ncbi:hypothetical protein VKT23_015562 [Stygiomarasmius scandens]|uniref:Uncharacterized protein n=1 Tax=Marasmiellus scandens TaxID=2682957 RepID=A0ABR1IXB1_9AGAR
MEESQYLEKQIMKLLQLHNTIIADKTNEELQTLISDTKTILKIVSKLSDVQNERERKAKDFIDSNGGTEAVRKDEDKVKSIAGIFKEHASTETVHIVKKDLKKLLEDSFDKFDKKVTEGKSEILENLLDTRAEIMAKV